MPFILQPIFTAIIGIALAIITGFVGTPRTAVAPTDMVPAIIPPSAASHKPNLKLPVATPKIVPAQTTPKKQAAATTTPKTAPTPPPVTEAPKIKTDLQALAQNLQNLAEPTTTPAFTTTQSVTDTVRAAVVNIVCTTKSGGSVNSISGSGVLIDSRGVIMTNSHVAQYFLLKDYPVPNFVNCIIRTGSPATPSYTAELLFFPPAWMAKNASKINDERPMGNGEYDYAFLRITGTVSSDVHMPSAFPFLAISTGEPVQNQDVLLAGYPAGFLGGITIATRLYAASANAEVGNLYSFEGTAIDLFSVGGTIVAQPGSSGGAVTDQNGTLIGLIVTATDAPDTASRDLRAIAMPFIISDFQKETGIPLSTFLDNDIAQEARSFALGTEPTLTAELVSAIQQK